MHSFGTQVLYDFASAESRTGTRHEVFKVEKAHKGSNKLLLYVKSIEYKHFIFNAFNPSFDLSKPFVLLRTLKKLLVTFVPAFEIVGFAAPPGVGRGTSWCVPRKRGSL